MGYYRTGRKLLHIAGGLPAFALPFIPAWIAVAGALTGVALTYVVKPQLALWLRQVSKPKDRKRGVITGFRGFSFAVLSLVLLYLLLDVTSLTQSAVSYCMFGWLALALGDGLAGLIGPSPRKATTVPWNRNKTVWGAMGCAAGTAVAYLLSFYLPWPGGNPAGAGWIALAAVSLIVTLLESLPWDVDDNYSVGLGAMLAALLLHRLLGGQF